VKILFRLNLFQCDFVYPVAPAPSTAILVRWFRSRGPRSRGTVRVFEGGWDARAAAYHPAAIAGTWRQMESLLADKSASPTHSVIVMSRAGRFLQAKDLFLSMKQRDQLWRAFRVPVFEQIIGENGALFAAECEAHCGLHIESPKLDVAGCSIERGPCGCGRKTPRLRGARIEDIRSAAANAR
jgi:hypothetical protein